MKKRKLLQIGNKTFSIKKGNRTIIDFGKQLDWFETKLHFLEREDMKYDQKLGRDSKVHKESCLSG